MIGYSYGFHDAAMASLDGSTIIEAHHAERFSGIKNDPNLISNIMRVGESAYYERPFLKNTRRLMAGQKWKKKPKHDHYISHHWSHAAAGYYTRPFEEEPVCVVIDAIGEWDTCSIWWKKKKVWSRSYPHSLGLLYTAITDYLGLRPMEDEYVTMGMAGMGEPIYDLSYMLDMNLHRGCKHLDLEKGANLAASAQQLIEDEIIKIMVKAKEYSSYLVYGGGVALNCVANTKIAPMFDKIWIFPSPGDSGSALGAAAAVQDIKLDWKGPYLGYNIQGEIDPKEVVSHLLKHDYCGIANGKAEFGPRALGNRSLIANPMKPVKDTVNQIKRRQSFRPFAPAILEEYAHDYFTGPMNEYMQYVALARFDDMSSVTHVDGTSRVQIVKKDCSSIIRQILEEWYEKTGCPLLLNTSLNIRGKPMVNSYLDALQFEIKYKVRVF